MFEHIIGQEKVKETLKQAVIKEQVSHSYIFSGPEGTQKSLMAQAFAKTLFCKGERLACGDCVPCKKMEDHNHPDLIDIFPQGAHIRIKQIRDLRQAISIKPYEGAYKVYIIHDADTMRTEAQNALLKTLEEPPSYAVMILLTNNVQGLLATIRSRSQTLQFHRVDQDSIENYLMEKEGLDSKKAREIALVANGRIEKALGLLQQENIFEEKEELLQYLIRILKGDIVCVFSTAQWLKDRKEQLEEWLDFLIVWFRDVLLFQELGRNPWIIHKEHEDLLRQFSDYLSHGQIHDIIEEVNTSKNNMKVNVNLQLNMEAMLLKIQEEYHDKSSGNTI